MSTAFGAAAMAGAISCAQPASKPNILWITCEDIGPELGCYGDSYADTPNIDNLASRSLRYLNASSNAPVCAPARTTIISGVFPPSLGAEHMRSVLPLPASMKMYPELLREQGYYVANNQKKDYNLLEPVEVWSESSKAAHWRNRADGQPFFAIFNFTTTHESQIRRRPHEAVHDPAKAPIPAYHPDTPEVRRDWAQYYDNITTMDAQAAKVLAELEADGLVDDTIVFFYGDHGSGMPRSKRWPYNSGLQVAMLLHVPDKFKHLAPADYQAGGTSDRPVGFVDLAPTLLSLAGAKPPAWMQGDAFAGAAVTQAPKYQFGFRGRMDERYDCVRACRDSRYQYLRQFMPHRIYGQHIAYMFETPTTQVWKRLYDEGKLQPPQTYFWETKPFEELYDLQSDPDEVKNLAVLPAQQRTPEQQAKLEEMRQATHDWMIRIRDVGLLPEAEIHSRSEGTTPYDMARQEGKYPMERVLAVAEAASQGYGAGAQPPMDLEGLVDADSAVRYWTILGLLMRGKDAVNANAPALRKALQDSAPSVRIAAAEALGRHGNDTDANAALDVLLQQADLSLNSLYVALAAVNAIDQMDQRAKPGLARLRALPREKEGLEQRLRAYVPRLIEDVIAKLSA
ncbi:MAG: sulfatase-like hydrolase/transferase [Bryobacterales bacterium]|nr:sulfatase-like hydrolase/transferase [Bryobacterales bacterium]